MMGFNFVMIDFDFNENWKFFVVFRVSVLLVQVKRGKKMKWSNVRV